MLKIHSLKWVHIRGSALLFNEQESSHVDDELFEVLAEPEFDSEAIVRRVISFLQCLSAIALHPVAVRTLQAIVRVRLQSEWGSRPLRKLSPAHCKSMPPSAEANVLPLLSLSLSLPLPL